MLPAEVTPGGSSSALRISILGPLTVSRGGELLPLGPLKQQQVLAMLASRANSVVPIDLLTEALWGDGAPRTARKNLQVYVTCLRRLLTDGGPERITHQQGGYLLRVEGGELDLLRFLRLAAEARAAGQPCRLAEGLAGALELWRGPMLDGLTRAPLIRAEAERQSGVYAGVFEEWADAELSAGNASAVVDRICRVAAYFPLRERLRQIQMTALEAAGRRGEALSVFDEFRQAMMREFGLRPSPASDRLYRTVLDGGASSQPVMQVPPPNRARVLLPPVLADFTGQDAVLRQLRELVEREWCRLTVLTGPVGIGKTALALRVAYQVADRFADGRLYLGMRTEAGTPRTARSALQALSRFAGLPSEDPEVELDELAGRWHAWLMDHQVLLVLDDACDGAVVRSVAPGASQVVVTTRRQLVGLECAARIEVGPMQPADAVALLGRIIGSGRVATDPAAAARIVQAVGRTPLAIRTAGIRLGALRHLPLAEFAARLERPNDLLDELCSGDSPLRSRLAVGFEELAEGERVALRRLGSLDSPSFTFDEAVAAISDRPGQVRRVLESLIEANAVSVPAAEVAAADAVYEVPGLLRCYTRALGVTGAR